MYEFLPDNPYRPVDWRWERSRTIQEGSSRFSKVRDDRWVHKACRFRKRLHDCLSDYDFHRLAQDMPDVWWAYQFHDQDDRPGKWELEARLLDVDAGYAGIAHKLNTTVEVIEAYENMFFNVREKLPHVGYITHVVMGPSIHRGLNERDFDLLWKLFGYHKGATMLDMLTTTFSSGARPRTPDEVDSCMHDDIITSIRRKSLIAGRVIPVNSFTGMEWLSQYNSWLTLEKNSDAAGDAQTTITSNLSAMMIGMPWQMAGTGFVDSDPAEIQQYDYGNAEMRADELLLATVEGDVPNPQLLKDLKFPEPIKHDKIKQGSGGSDS